LSHFQDGTARQLVCVTLSPVISQAVMQLFASRDVRKSWARAIVQMRHAFGGHPLGPDEDVAKERREGRVGE
jgi:6-phosphogluconate dehydrogenase